MKKIISLTSIVVICLILTSLTGCRSTTTTTVYNQDGSIEKVIESSETPVKSITEDLKDKTVVIADRGWVMKIKAEMSGQESPVPSGYIGGGKVDHLYMSIKKGDMQYVPYVISQWRQDLVISAMGVSIADKNTAINNLPATSYPKPKKEPNHENRTDQKQKSTRQ